VTYYLYLGYITFCVDEWAASLCIAQRSQNFMNLWGGGGLIKVTVVYLVCRIYMVPITAVCTLAAM